MKKITKTSIAFLLIIALLISFSGCSPSAPAIKAGSVTGTAGAYHGTLTVTAEIGEDGTISAIIVGNNHETDDVGTVAIEKFPQRSIDAQSLGIDVISGATLTCNGISNAVADALVTAGADPAAYGYIPPVVE